MIAVRAGNSDARVEETAPEQTFTLPCGCVAVSRPDVPFEVRWCPHHEQLHGVMPCTFATPSRS
ncbi:MAG: hypothetical protein JO199_14000 [Candidatus Eremiobacteraeota bacterium]|nr:hypothetical protein [Candidatus Eremiobacteraeota bacterium]